MKAQSVSQLLIAEDNSRIEISGSRFRVGRSPHCDFRSDNPSISRRHAEFTVHGDHVTLQDLGSSNGTKVNGKRITQCVLNPNDVVTLANQDFRYEMESRTETSFVSGWIERLRDMFGRGMLDKGPPPLVTQCTMSNEPREQEVTEPMIHTLGKKREASEERAERPADVDLSQTGSSSHGPLQLDECANTIPKRNLTAAGSVDI